MEPGLEDIIFFKTDDEFADFAIGPFATINEQNGRMVITCGYSTLYEDAVRQGKKFVIMNGSFKSRENKDGKVAKKYLLNPSILALCGTTPGSNACSN